MVSLRLPTRRWTNPKDSPAGVLQKNAGVMVPATSPKAPGYRLSAARRTTGAAAFVPAGHATSRPLPQRPNQPAGRWKCSCERRRSARPSAPRWPTSPCCRESSGRIARQSASRPAAHPETRRPRRPLPPGPAAREPPVPLARSGVALAIRSFKSRNQPYCCPLCD